MEIKKEREKKITMIHMKIENKFRKVQKYES